MIGKFVMRPGNSILGMWQDTHLSLATGQALAPGLPLAVLCGWPLIFRPRDRPGI
jgi:hypothetical protein